MTLYARIGNGTWNPETEIRQFRVEFEGSDDENFRVQVNDELDYWTGARLMQSKAPGDEVAPHDLESLKVGPIIVPADRFIEGRQMSEGWDVSMKLARVPAVRTAHLDAGREFAAQAESAYASGHVRALYECAFHAVEHLAKAELLTYPPAEHVVKDAKTHGALRSAYQLWARLGNTEARYAQLLNRLSGLRRVTTYEPERPLPTTADARADLDTLADLLSWVTDVVENDAAHRVVRLHATTDLRAGQFVGIEDATLRPPPRAR